MTFAFLFTFLHYNQVRLSTGLTFFKLTLYSEWLRESRIWKLISVLMVLWFFGFLAIMWYLAEHPPLIPGTNKTQTNELVKVDPNAPKPWKFAFVILLGAYVYELYNIVTYEEAYDELMLPSWETISKMYPEEYKTASTKKIVLGEDQQGSCLLRHGFAPYQFEPNFDIRSSSSSSFTDGFMWALTDSATHLKNVMLVCGFIAAQMKKRTCEVTKTVEEFRADPRWKDDPKLNTDSLPFQCVSSLPFRFSTF